MIVIVIININIIIIIIIISDFTTIFQVFSLTLYEANRLILDIYVGSLYFFTGFCNAELWEMTDVTCDALSGCKQVLYSVQFSYKTSAWTFRTRNMH